MPGKGKGRKMAILSVTVHAICKADVSGKCDLLIDGSGIYNSNQAYFAHPNVYVNLTTEWTDYSFTWLLNPNKNAPWTDGDIKNLKFGVWLWSSAFTTGAAKCTQIYVEVENDDGTTYIVRPRQDWNPYGIFTENYLAVGDEVPDNDGSWISYTTSGGSIPDAGNKFLFWQLPRRKLTLQAEGYGIVPGHSPAPFYVVNTYNFIYVDGDVVTLTAPQNENYAFMGWEGDVSDQVNPTTSVLMNADKVVTAVYEALPPYVYLYTYVQGSGSVELSGDGVLTSYGMRTRQGYQITITALPAEGWIFDHWEGGGQNGTVIDDPTSIGTFIMMNGNASVTAVFREPEVPPPPPPEEKAGFPWWILALLGGTAWIANMNKKKKKNER